MADLGLDQKDVSLREIFFRLVRKDDVTGEWRLAGLGGSSTGAFTTVSTASNVLRIDCEENDAEQNFKVDLGENATTFQILGVVNGSRGVIHITQTEGGGFTLIKPTSDVGVSVKIRSADLSGGNLSIDLTDTALTKVYYIYDGTDLTITTHPNGYGV